MAEPTVAEVLKIEESHKPKYSPFVVLVVFIVLPPLAFFMMWEEVSYHKYFKPLLLFYGLAYLIFGILGLFLLAKLAVIYQNLNIPQSTQRWPFILSWGTVVFGISQTVFGVFFKKENKTMLTLAMVILILGTTLIGVLVAISTLGTILPIYTATQIPEGL